MNVASNGPLPDRWKIGLVAAAVGLCVAARCAWELKKILRGLDKITDGL